MDYMDAYLSLRCVLCCRKHDGTVDFKNIKETRVNTSKKSVKEVLTHLAKCIKGEVTLQDSAYVCKPCFDKLAEYDQVMLQLLVHQRELSRLLETSMNTLDVYDEDIQVIKIEALSDNSIEADIEENDNSSQDMKETSSDTPSGSPYHCTVCDKKLSSKFSLTTHLASHDKAVRCDICGVLRRDREYLELHMNVHEGKSENECRFCPKRYSRRSNVIRHMHLHWDKKKFQCEKCGLRFSQSNLLYNHKMHHEAEEKPLICEKCDQTFKSRKTFAHHMLTHREDRPMYPCLACGKRFTEKYTLKIHSKCHESTSGDDEQTKKNGTSLKKKAQKEFPCVICNKVLGAKDVLEEHMTSVHDVICRST